MFNTLNLFQFLALPLGQQATTINPPPLPSSLSLVQAVRSRPTTTKQQLELLQRQLKLQQQANARLLTQLQQLERKVDNSLKGQESTGNKTSPIGTPALSSTDQEQLKRLLAEVRQFQKTQSAKSEHLSTHVNLAFATLLALAIMVCYLAYRVILSKSSSPLIQREEKQDFSEDLHKLLKQHEHYLTSIQAHQDTSGKPDHTLALLLANEVSLIERNLQLMRRGAPGLKQLARSLRKLKDNLASLGYEIIPLLGQEYKEGMRLNIVHSLSDSSLPKGEERISKVLLPQVNFDGQMIQVAQVEVSIGI